MLQLLEEKKELILDTVKDKLDKCYAPEQLAVVYNVVGNDEGYYIAKVNGWGLTAITEILAHDGEVNDMQLEREAKELGVACYL